MASFAVHSLFEVGFEYGKMTGRSFRRAISWITAGVNAPATVLTPTMALGLMAFTTSSSSRMGGLACA